MHLGKIKARKPFAPSKNKAVKTKKAPNAGAFLSGAAATLHSQKRILQTICFVNNDTASTS